MSSPIAMVLTLLFTTACRPAQTPPIEAEADPAPLRRLTTSQYNRTVRDLFEPAAVPLMSFPSEILIGGFENNAAANTASPAYVDAAHQAAVGISKALGEQLPILLDCVPVTEDCANTYLAELSKRAFRRPLEAQEQSSLQENFQAWASEYGPEIALQLSIQYLLQSPAFLYFPEYGNSNSPKNQETALTSWEVASRLSYFLWGSLPDATLFELAENNELTDRDVVIESAWRMLGTKRASEGLKEFTRQWLELDDIGNISVDFDLFFPGQDEEDVANHLHHTIYTAMLLEPEVLVDRVVFEKSGTLAELLTTTEVWTTEALVDYYGGELNEHVEPLLWNGIRYRENGLAEYGVDFRPIDLDANKRGGLLTLASMLHARSKPTHPSPILRGLFVLERVLCEHPGSPPDNLNTALPTAVSETGTNRDRYAAHTSNPACASCHNRIDSLGFAFEHYDVLGDYRTTDNGQPIDASGELIGTDQDGPFEDAIGLTQRLAKSRDVHDCFVTQVFRHSMGRLEVPSDEVELDFLANGFWESGGDIPELFVNVATSHAFRHIESTP
ncbi:MAG: DUF1588 domain-containing protein [Myxococcota bacterium]|nr:DUF1588 domain-containing protein [Myxococcota bacterium]